MWLINVNTIELEEFKYDDIPEYTILSHRWQKDEVTYNDMKSADRKHKLGYCKIVQTCRLTARMGLKYTWVDTCCINKNSLVELADAIKSMFKWYRRAQLCIAFLYDVGQRNHQFAGSSWFTRAWTLQELIAPHIVKFYDGNWDFLGTKKDLVTDLSAITAVDLAILDGSQGVRRFSVAQRMSWAVGREAERPEDTAYSLLGLFDVEMPLLYGEGQQKAFLRLQKTIIADSDDQSIFAWDIGSHFQEYSGGLLATSALCFARCGKTVRRYHDRDLKSGFVVTNAGVNIELLTIPYSMNTSLAILACGEKRQKQSFNAILVQRLERNQQFVRVTGGKRSVYTVTQREIQSLNTLDIPLTINVRQEIVHCKVNKPHAIWLRKFDLPNHSKHALRRATYISRNVRTYLDPTKEVVFQFPPSCHGTAGIIYAPSKTWKGRISWLKFGFTAEFAPSCVFGTYSSKHKLVQPHNSCNAANALKSWPRTKSDMGLFDNSWLSSNKCQNMNEEDWNRYGCCTVVGSQKDGIQYLFPHLKLIIRIYQSRLSLIDPTRLQRGTKLWDDVEYIWTFDIISTVGYGRAQMQFYSSMIGDMIIIHQGKQGLIPAIPKTARTQPYEAKLHEKR